MYQNVALLLANTSIALQENAVGPAALTTDRLWATLSAVLALVSVIVGGLALTRSANRGGTATGSRGGRFALVAGTIAGVIGGIVLATADGGPGTGNGIVGAIAALALGLLAVAFGGLALTRARRAI